MEKKGSCGDWSICILMNRAEVTVAASVTSHDWLRVASNLAREAAAAAGVEWLDADVFVSLPEPGRCFTKSPGRTAICANG